MISYKCDRCKGDISPDTRQKIRNIYNISYMGTYMDLCDNCYNKFVRFINNVDKLSKIESLINNWAVDDDEHILLERIANIVDEDNDEEEEDEKW